MSLSKITIDICYKTKEQVFEGICDYALCIEKHTRKMRLHPEQQNEWMEGLLNLEGTMKQLIEKLQEFR